jgi:hypothetical protein
VPAGSLEDDDDVLADAAMCEQAKWAEVREEVLRGWVKCSDGRLYHPVVCERVREAWTAKVERREKNAHETDRKRLEREERASHFRLLKAADIHRPWNASLTELRELVRGLSAGQVPDGPTAVRDLSRLREGQGEGQGQGQGQGDKNPPKPPRKRRGAAAQDVFVTAEQIVANGVNEKHARDWLAIRKEKNLPLTPTAWDETKAEAVKAGMTTDEAIRYSVVRSRGGFRASWIASDAPTASVAGKVPQSDAARQAANDETDAEALRILSGRAAGSAVEIGHG